MTINLSQRSREILEAIIEDYIATAEPVGSSSVARRHQLSLSPATIRSVMSDLEEQGFLSSPHTSSGRVPTDKGYRLYVDSLVALRRITKDEKKAIVSNCRASGASISDILKEAGKTISTISNYMGIVLAPSFNSDLFRHIEFIRLGAKKTLAILVTANGIVQNRIIEGECDFSSGELATMSNYLNELIQGLTISEARAKIVAEMRNEKILYDSLMAEALKMSERAVSHTDDEELIVEGSSRIFEQPEFSDIQKMKDIFSAFEQKGQLLELLHNCMLSDGVQIFIGAETPLSRSGGISMVTSRFVTHNNSVGLLGVIGPTRMGYSNVIPVVDYTARMLSKLLKSI